MSIINPCFLLSKNLILIFLGIFGIGFIIGFHELGHFLFSKLFRVNVPAFAIGFGPKLFKKQIGETKFSLGAIPLGGYVETNRESFDSKPYYQKMLVIGGGIAFNLLFAYFVFCLLFMLGLPKTRFLYATTTTPKIEAVTKDAQSLGIKPGDKIVNIDGKEVKGETKIVLQQLKESKNNTVKLKLSRVGQLVDLQLDKKKFLQALGTFKISFKYVDRPGLPLFQAIKKGIQFTNAYIYMSVMMFKNMLVKRDTSGVGGPVMIIAATMQSAAQGLKVFLLLLALISISLAILNLIPLPILDGGQALLYTIEAIIRKPLSEKIKEYIFIASWIFMLALFVLISFRDIWRLFGLAKFFGGK